MFESHFGFSAPPFQLSPDPSFYFESKGHGQALSYLKYGVYQREGFIVVTGEIGSGKTTLVRTLLGGLDPRELVAAQVVNTQLDSYDLLHAICTAFGVPVAGTSKAAMLATLEAFFTALAASGRRALLVVDEAQNLGPKEVEELRMLSNFQLGAQALLQSFLVGQPELRLMLRSATMEQLRQRVIASCHLGPMNAGETRAYVEHRLRHVGWKEFPAFADAAFTQIHAASGGIPRRINVLCTRVLLACWLAGKDRIEAGDVADASAELGSELGGAGVPGTA
jgi:general secretion pathway protein A